MSRGVKWRLEWAFFPGENGRRQYNRLCKGCVPASFFAYFSSPLGLSASATPWITSITTALS